MQRFCKALGVIIFLPLVWLSPGVTLAADSGCLTCHNGIESIRDESSAMQQLINSLSAVHGDTAGCIMCHGGDPGDMDINKFTCGQSACQAGYHSALLIGMHKNQLADAYTLFLYNDHEQAKILINAALSTLSFTPTSTTIR